MALDDRWRGARASLQASTWRGHDDITVLSPLPDRPAPGVDDVRREVERLREAGIRRVLTGALHQGELAPFEQVGFVEHERLHLLRHDLLRLPEATVAVKGRRAWRRDIGSVLTIDERAFDGFWALDRRGLDDAVPAPPSSRFRVAVEGEGTVTGYAITGRAADRGYLQRLAVEPTRHRAGIGRALVVDS